MKAILEEPIIRDPLLVEQVDPEHIEDLNLSTGGFLCLIGYWIFAGDVFDANHVQPKIPLFPEHHGLLQRFLADEPQVQIVGNPGTIEALLLMAISIVGRDGVVGPATVSPDADGKSQYMSYHHLLTLVSVFHTNVRARNAATELAGKVLHADPDPNDRLTILEDLLENCMFASLQAEAVRWLREELYTAYENPSDSSPFSTPDAVEKLQYALFPPLSHLKDPATPLSELVEFWASSVELHLKVASFALFLFGGKDGQAGHPGQTPEGMKAAVEERYVEPMLECVKRLEAEGEEQLGSKFELEVMRETLEKIPWQ